MFSNDVGSVFKKPGSFHMYQIHPPYLRKCANIACGLFKRPFEHFPRYQDLPRAVSQSGCRDSNARPARWQPGCFRPQARASRLQWGAYSAVGAHAVVGARRCGVLPAGPAHQTPPPAAPRSGAEPGERTPQGRTVPRRTRWASRDPVPGTPHARHPTPWLDDPIRACFRRFVMVNGAGRG